ncbi:hypothetical protein ODJ79_39260 [Actinoplanes sp. KI2]|uniref:hypothetical protein n=1 Tax=Actinoplanes sp. KI2 TaxID=2983315 RepID=UPI0021D58109|nr:hypothetical protein [Actinoplanes sp. KI2]MCU7729794.1 hypothetical protein [Actinoplanes sp. KI2]
MEERRRARIGTVSGLALLTGGTAVAAVAGGAHSIFATILLGLLAFGMTHSLHVEIRRQAHRWTGWCRADAVNIVLLACWAAAAVVLAIEAGPIALRLVGAALAAAYVAGCGYFIIERRRSIAALPAPAVGRPQRVPSKPGF